MFNSGHKKQKRHPSLEGAFSCIITAVCLELCVSWSTGEGYYVADILHTRTGFGFDGQNTETQSMDFAEVRGQFESNPFVKAVEEHIQTKSALAEKWLKLL